MKLRGRPKAQPRERKDRKVKEVFLIRKPHRAGSERSIKYEFENI